MSCEILARLWTSNHNGIDELKKPCALLHKCKGGPDRIQGKIERLSSFSYVAAAVKALTEEQKLQVVF